MKRTILIWIIILLYASCETFDWVNPFDSQCPKDIWTPTNFNATVEGNTVKLTWNQPVPSISGFQILKKVDNGEEISLTNQSKSSTQLIDANVLGGKLHTYRIFAYANKNESNSVTISVTPVITATLTTSIASNITFNSAVIGGSVTNDGGAEITEHGVCWSLNSSPTVVNSKLAIGNGLGDFSNMVTGLTPGTRYYFRAYAINSSGTAYGTEVVVNTLSEIPTLTTIVASAITPTGAISGGNIAYSGSSEITERGVCWNTSPNPTIANSKSNNGVGSGNYTVDVTGLTPNKTYYYKAYAINSNGIAYGNELQFTTANASLPSLSTIAPIYHSLFQYLSTGGAINNSGGVSITEVGICWGFSPNPTINNNKIVDTVRTIPFSFTSHILGLTGGNTYYIRAYATNIIGTAYGNEVSYSTSLMPSVSTNSAISVTAESAMSGGSIINFGSAITAEGVCWSTSPNPTIVNSKTSEVTLISNFMSSLTGLAPSTTYYTRAYATNANGTAYGNQVSFTTLTLSIPTLSTSVVSSLTLTSGIFGGSISNDGGSPITDKGVCWSTSPNPTISNNKSSIPGPQTPFIGTVTGLTQNTTYYYRAYATNGAGTAYGQELSVTTPQPSIPLLTTNVAYSITSISSWGGGSITSDGGSPVTARGICWSTNHNPTIMDNKANDSFIMNPFSGSMTNLNPNTTYYFRSYATNSIGTGYGSELSFTTLQLALPTVTTTTVISITATGGTFGGNITNDGGSPLSENGVCWSTSPSPTISGNKLSMTIMPPSFSGTVTGLTQNTTYYYRAYATNSIGTAYGQELSVTTPQPSIPLLTTNVAYSITGVSAWGGGSITSDGGSPVNARGICWSTNHNPTIMDNKANDSFIMNPFSGSMTNLNPNTTYYFRSYATNSIGTGYGSELSFTTLQLALPTITTIAVTSLTATSGIFGGTIVSDGGEALPERGVCWSTNHNPTTNDNKTINATFISINSFTSTVTGLTPNTTYYYRAYAANSIGTAYGQELSVTTPQPSIPVVTTNAAYTITANLAWGGTVIMNDGGSPVNTRGICWSTSHNPTINDNKASDNFITGPYSGQMTGLTANTTYYFRAFATNSIGTGYGSEMSFTTLQLTLPTLTTTTVISITATGGTFGGYITNDGGSPLSDNGVCWSTSPSPTISSNKLSMTNMPPSFSGTVTGLTQNTTYYYRAYATNSIGTAYGQELTLTTPALSLPVLTTTIVSNVGPTSAQGGGNITNNGGSSIGLRGICWSTSTNPTISNNRTQDGAGSGNFMSTMTGLAASTNYYYRAYAINDLGIAYGNELNFTTLPPAVPTLTTNMMSLNSATSGSGGGWINNDNGSPVTARGVCWGTSANPTINDSKTTDGTGNDMFSSSITGLTPGTIYYYRAYATNSVGTGYGNQLIITTQNYSTPTLTTSTPTTTAGSLFVNGTGNITSNGGYIISTTGFCWSTNQNPTISDNKSSNPYMASNFSNSLLMSAFGTYYIRAYLTTSAGDTYYGNQVSITTQLSVPVLSTSPVTGISSTAATAWGNVQNAGGEAVWSSRGFCWSKSPNPTTSDSKIIDSTPYPSFNSQLTDLTPNTTYYVRAFATNSVGVGYGESVSFTTQK